MDRWLLDGPLPFLKPECQTSLIWMPTSSPLKLTPIACINVCGKGNREREWTRLLIVNLLVGEINCEDMDSKSMEEKKIDLGIHLGENLTLLPCGKWLFCMFVAFCL